MKQFIKDVEGVWWSTKDLDRIQVEEMPQEYEHSYQYWKIVGYWKEDGDITGIDLIENFDSMDEAQLTLDSLMSEY